MSDLPVSVVIVSRDRPRFLRRCLTAVGQLDYPVFEIVVVACPAGVQAARHTPLDVDVSVTDYDAANISEARNLGIAQSRGAVVAFIDDDAVPEPTWLAHLVAPFADHRVAQAGGTTLGRNGISVQQAAARVTLCGMTVAYPYNATTPFALPVENDLFPRLHGTNMAVRRSVLVAQNGFDPGFAFYLDETDLTLRIAASGGMTMHVPKAVVHHASGASIYRKQDRTPRRVFEIAASASRFHQKHTPPQRRDAARRCFLQERRTWLLRHLQRGTLGPDDVARLLRELNAGYDSGTGSPVPSPVWPDAAGQGHIRPTPKDRPHSYLVSRPGSRSVTTEKARKLVADGMNVTVFHYDASARYHRVAYTEDGYWWHSGGIFGKELRTDPLFQWARRHARVMRSLRRLSGIRSKYDPVACN